MLLIFTTLYLDIHKNFLTLGPAIKLYVSTFELAVLFVSNLVVLWTFDAFVSRGNASVNAESCIHTWIQFLTYWANLKDIIYTFLLFCWNVELKRTIA